MLSVTTKHLAAPAASMSINETTCTLVNGQPVCFATHLDDVGQYAGEVQDLDVVELWCGVGSIVRAAKEAGLAAEGFDLQRVPGETDLQSGALCEDITCKAGFLRALALVLRVRPGGLVWMAPDCSSWVWLNSSNTKRSEVNGYWGDPGYAKVASGNQMAIGAAFLYHVAVNRRVEAVIENPVSSFLFKFLAKTNVASLPQFLAVCPRCAYSTEAFGRRVLKRYKFLATGPWVEGLSRRCRCPNGAHAALAQHNVSVSGKVSVTGNTQALKKSAAYPIALGRAIVRACLQAVPPPSKKRKQIHNEPVAEQTEPDKAEVESSWKRPSLSASSVSTLSSGTQASTRGATSRPLWCCPAL